MVAMDYWCSFNTVYLLTAKVSFGDLSTDYLLKVHITELCFLDLSREFQCLKRAVWSDGEMNQNIKNTWIKCQFLCHLCLSINKLVYTDIKVINNFIPLFIVN